MRRILSSAGFDGPVEATDAGLGFRREGAVRVRYLMTLNGGGPVPDQQLFADMAVFVEELTKAGVLLATGGLEPLGTHNSASGGQATMIDGPYAEAKETIVSFALIDVRSDDEARELARRFFAVIKEGEGDIRRVYGPEG